MLADEICNWNFFDFPKRNQRDDGTSVTSCVSFVTSIIKLLENSCFKNLTVVKNFLKRCTWVWSSRNNFCSDWVIPLTSWAQKCWNFLANIRNVRAESFQTLIKTRTFDFISMEEMKLWCDCSPVIWCCLNHGIRWIGCINDWSKRDKKVYFILQFSMVVRKSRKHLRSSLRVANIRNLILTCNFSYIVNLSWCIILSKFKETIIKELCVIWTSR